MGVIYICDPGPAAPLGGQHVHWTAELCRGPRISLEHVRITHLAVSEPLVTVLLPVTASDVCY